MAAQDSICLLDSPELTTINECTVILVSNISHDVGGITDALICKHSMPEGLLESLRMDNVVRSERARKIVDYITDCIRKNPLVYHEFVTVLEDQGDWMKECTTKMKACYEANKAAVSQRVARDSPSFVCPFCEKCSLAEYCKRGCPNKETTETEVPPRFPLLNTSKLNKKDREILETKLDEDFDVIEDAFGEFCVSLSTSQLPIDKVVVFLLSKSMFTGAGALNEELRKAKSMVDVLKVLGSEYISFFNYEILEKIINKYGTSGDKEKLQAYLAKFQKYCERNIFEIPCLNFHRATGKEENVSRFALKYTEEAPISVGQIKTLCRKVSKILQIDPCTLCLMSVEEGCVVLRFAIPRAIASDVFPLSKSQQEALSKSGLKVLSEGEETKRQSTIIDYPQFPSKFYHEESLNIMDFPYSEQKSFGQRRPPLSVTIKGILERYPDGQIFKEMIQNADDAGAKTVWFYVDERQHGTSNLPHPGLARFQGPALVAANDACFTEEDWEGIQSLQQSVKAEDPFKVGRFGIGFNSVYHLTDLPVIVSGNRLACFEPQEKMWRGKSGQAFKLSDLISQSSDFVAPLNGLADFDSHSVRYGGYSQTIFRLPLRREASGLSDNIYNTQKLQELLGALREEAKYLLLFLKSVCKIQVVHISQYGQHSTSFCVEIAPGSLATVSAKRDSFMQQLKQAHVIQPYQITNVISFTAQFSVLVTDSNTRRNQAGTSNWLIANCVGSADPSVKEAAAKQRTFPWVGGALELGGSSAGGRIFCFLPMPVEAASGLPIHVNGTFGLNDERRSLKWPGIERRNDPTANWNKILVSQLLPPCYAMLLTESKKHISPEQFYRAWPDVKAVKGTQFSEILQPLLTALFKEAVLWTEKTEALQQVGNWIPISQATFVSDGSTLASVVKKVLSSCGVQLVTVPAVIWRAIQFARVGITEVSPKLARSNMRSYPGSYSNIDQYGKRVILTYCLSDSCYNDLSGLSLLPLANGSFTDFAYYYGGQLVYLCSDDCPRSLLPNLDHLLVDLSDDPSLQMVLYQVAASQQTKLRVLTEREVATLLPQAMPPNWRTSSLVSMPHSQLPSTWLQTFWNWLKGKNLKLFSNQLLVPCYSSTSHSTSSFYLARLNSAQPVVYVSSSTSCPSSLLSALYKMNVKICLQSQFGYVEHRQLSSYIKQLDTNNVLDVTYSQSSYKGVVFTTDEADSLRNSLISGAYSPTSSRKAVLQNLAIFSTASNSQGVMHSVSSAASQSIARQALGEPGNCAISVSNLPPNLILLSRENYHQKQLLQNLQLSFPSDYTLLVNYIFPLIITKTFPDHLIDNLMSEVLDMFQVLNTRERRSNLSENLKSLPFVKTVYGRKTPAELFTPYNTDIAALYSGEDMFPQSPYNTPQRIQVLISCGLQTAVTSQQVLDIVYSISSPASSYPQQVDSTKLSRAKAVLEYISTPSFHRQTGGYYTSPILRGNYSFSNALQQLATSRCWLPVLSSKPTDYCDELSWKGNGYDPHFISLNSSVVVPSSSTVHTLPHLVGSQMYLVSPTVSPQIAAMLPTDSASIPQHVVAHFKEVLAHKDQLSVEVLNSLVHRVYHYMNSEGAPSLGQLYSIADWIYMKRENKLVAPAVVALAQNHTFRRDLEPYIYILPDSLSQYTTLFGTASEVKQTVSQDQILSILPAIKEEVESETQRTSAEEAWDLVLSILNWLTSNGSKGVDQSIDVYVPVETESEWPQLVTASEVVYTDNDFMKNYLQSSDEENEYTFVHKRIGTRLAHAVGVVPLTEFLDISEDTFKDAGQYEPLTTRLKNILRDYKDGLTIIKELLQNADDAEATEMNICYDTRQHETDPKKLFFSGMVEAHGPALIVHNNSTFSDDDFKNITKLAGATKYGNTLKIGKFGIGFCSVYHMTDAPSFISRDHFYIFDPTLSYLRKEIKNPVQPGKKTKFTHKFISRSGQLSPYDGLFGFDRSEYKGTMFRFPFRTHASELSGTCYTEATVRELISAIRESSTNLLLFLQHVRTITFQRIDQGQTTPQVVLKISRENMSPSLPLSLPTGTEIRKLSCTTSSDDTSSCQWLVSQKQMNYSQQNYSTASIACPLGSSEYKVDASFEGEVFCFLPLSQKTGLPVHISSNFAVINNRRGIWTSDEATSQTDREVEWNINLMKGVIAKTYHTILLALKEMSKNRLISEYTFHQLWPKEEKLLQHNPWGHMIRNLYQLISSDQLFFSNIQIKWLFLNESKFLTPGILCQVSEQLLTPACVLDVLKYLNIPIVDLPVTYSTYFDLREVTINESAFTELFFKNLSKLELILGTRSEVIQYMLEVYAAEYDDGTDRSYVLDEYFKKYACIPCTPDGKVLRKCTELIDPTAEFAQLFNSSEGCFPIEKLSNRHLSYTALRDLGIISETLPTDMLVERTKTIPELYKTDQINALKRVKLILATMKKNKRVDIKKTKLPFIPFLPVLPKPPGYLFKWKGGSSELMCGKDLMIVGSHRYHKDRNSLLVGSQVAFVNEGDIINGGCGFISEDNLFLLKIRKHPSVEEVIAHLREVQETFLSRSQTSPEKYISFTNKACHLIYEFLDGGLKPETQPTSSDHEPPPLMYTDIKADYGISHVWTGKQFVETEQVAREWNIDGPYLYPWPASVSSRHNLIECLQLKQRFTHEDAQKALKEMGEDYGENPVNEHCKDILKDIVALLQKSDLASVDPHNLTLLLPDEDFVLRLSNSLEYIDVDWAPKDPSSKYVNEIVPSKLAKQLGIRAVRSKMLKKFTSHYEFGQREELTARIQNILRDYPLDITILKELLQNAEDAKATKMYVILDCRTHGSKGVLSDNWSKLQGPALLVWNDSVFSEKDLKGIQQLGLGSKRNDAETIGQYGIGFNAVYHLTDCPSFITGGETLCVLDPHCEYIDEANKSSPGRRFNVSGQKFWELFHDMGPAFLRSGLSGCPPELNNGTLFRFPLRHNLDLVNSSKIIDNTEESLITVPKMNSFLNEWAPLLKQALLFLTSVSQLQFMIIHDETDQLEILYKYCVSVDTPAQLKRQDFHKVLSSFKSESGNHSCVIRYPLTFTDTSINSSGKDKPTEEKWLIQQGVGDIDNEQQEWTFIESLKPRHGIASLLHSTHFDINGSNLGQIFCFLPLPISSNLPVHINGNFILQANRRSFWRSSESEAKDTKSLWNDRIFQSLVSSYANFLDHAREYYVPNTHYSTFSDAKAAIENYYRIFPYTEDLDVYYQHLVQSVYSKIVEQNSSILAVIDCDEVSRCNDAATNESDSINVRVIWYPLKSDNPLSQVYFADFLQEWDDVRPTVENIGMRLTIASSSLQHHLNQAISEQDLKDKLQSTTPETVFDFYVTCTQIKLAHQFPCAIKNTVFKDVSTFKRFTQYLLEGMNKVSPDPTLSDQGTLKFPKDPFDHPFLLTADSILRKFREDAKVVKSCFSTLFPEAHEYFLHPDLLDIDYSRAYFLSRSPQSDNVTEYEYSLKLVKEIFSKQLPESLRVNMLEQLPENFSQDDLTSLWKCLSTDQIFSQHQSELLKDWALLPATSGTLYSYGDHLVPVMPLETDEETDEIFYQMYKLLQEICIPFLDTAVIGCNAGSTSCPTLQNETAVLKSLYHFDSEKISALKFTKEQVEIAVSYFANIGFHLKLNNRKYIRALPLFDCVDGERRALHSTVTFIWPKNALKTGLSSWNDSSIIFLTSSSSWKVLDSPENLGIQEITEETLYCEFIFKSFSSLTKMERYDHLIHIRDELFPFIKVHMNKTDSSREEANTFWQTLKDLPCISDIDTCPLRPVKQYYDNKIRLLTIFNKEYLALPDIFTNSDSWEKWFEFFKNLGLKYTVNQDEFLIFCNETADGSISNIKTASSALLEYLMSTLSWHTEARFIEKVANVPFVPAEPVPELTWMHEPVTNSREQVMLKEAATLNCSVHLWTIKPLVKLPEGWQSHSQLLEQLEVVFKAEEFHVMQNLLNICTTGSDRLAIVKEHPPEGRMALMQIMAKHFDVLQHDLSKEHVELLKDVPCIPVNLSSEEGNQQVILVKPSCVLLDGKLKAFHPYLHRLDPQLLTYTSFFRKIGVRLTVGLKHLQLVLEQAYKDSQEEELKQERKHCVSAAVRKLYQLLSDPSHSSEDDASKQQAEKISAILSPLYLPNHEGKLALSTTLLYADNDLLEGVQPQLEDTDYSLLKIERTSDLDKGILLERELCDVLPEQVKPTALSSVCALTVADDCECVDHANVGEELQATLEMSKRLSEAVAFCVQFFTKTHTNLDTIKTRVNQLLSNITIYTYKCLKITVTIEATGKVVGSIQTKYYLKMTDNDYSPHSSTGQVFLDVRLNKKTKIIRTLSNHLLHLIRAISTGFSKEAIQQLSEILIELLDAQSFIEISQVLEDSPVSAIICESWRTKLEEELPLVEPNPAEGRRWLKQAEANFKSLLYLHSGIADKKICGDVCFMAHQVAEKALKGGMYFVCGLSSGSLKSHSLNYYANSLESKHQTAAAGLASHAASLERHYLHARYPNVWEFPLVPAEEYGKADSEVEAAKSHAEAILKIVKKLVVS